jgi:hypothetical protein
VTSEEILEKIVCEIKSELDILYGEEFDLYYDGKEAAYENVLKIINEHKSQNSLNKEKPEHK